MAATDFKILIIDTDEEILSSVQTALKTEGFQTKVCSNSREAIRIAKEEQPQLVLLELLMPELDGIDISIELRQNVELENTLIVFHTERNEDYSQIARFYARSR